MTTKPEYEVILGDTNDYVTTSFVIKVKSAFPYKSLTASMDGEPIELTKLSAKSFGADVTRNGVLEFSMINFNGMPAASYEQISILDDNPPTLSDQVIEDGVLTIYLEDSQSGIDESSIYAVSAAGATRRPLTIDKETGELTFSMDPDGLTIHAKDRAGNEVVATCTPQPAAAATGLEQAAEAPPDVQPTGTDES
jgi:hypothetical protein